MWRWWARPAAWAGLVVVVWLLVGGPLGSFQGRLAEVQENDAAAFLPASAEATRVSDLERQFAGADVLPAVVVYVSDQPLTDAQLGQFEALADRLGQQPGLAGPVRGPTAAPDGLAVELLVPVANTPTAADTVGELRELVAAEAPAGTIGYLTGPAGFAADLGAAFGDIDGRLLVVTASVVAVILVLVYRSPLLPLLVLLGAGLALGTASAAVYGLASADVIVLNGQSQGIMLILVFGAATDYALLLVARFREELLRHQDRYAAMRVAWRRTLGPVLASGGTVILALLCLLLSDLNSNRGLGPVAAVGVAAAMLVMLTYLPAVLVLVGRAGFWPYRPRFGSAPAGRAGWWRRLAGLVGRRPRRVWVVTALALAALAALVPQLHADGVSESDLFLGEVESVRGQEALGEHFPAGDLAPTVVIAEASHVAQVVAAAQQVPGVVQVRPAGEAGGLARVQVILADPPDSDAAVDTVPRLRAAVRGVAGAEALVGGASAVAYDTRQAAIRDQRVIIPVALVVVFLVIAVLLRALLATALVLASVVLSFFATLGLAAVVFNHVFSFPGADPSLPLFAFVFLVALGVDYSIFLLTRVREEAIRHGTRPGVQTGLAVTGPVITSAGVVLAATFSALGVIPILFLAQIGFLVAAGVLIDTFVVRSLLVPGISYDLDRRVWWPSRLARSPVR